METLNYSLLEEPKKKGKRFVRSKRELHPDIQFQSNAIPLPLKIFYAVVWFAALGLFIYFVTKIGAQLQDSAAEPSSRLVLVPRHQVQLPTVALCNWNPDDEGTREEDFQLVQCLQILGGERVADCSSQYHFRRISDNETDTKYSCYLFNIDIDSVSATTNISGYTSSHSLLFSLSKTVVPVSGRRGVQVTFTQFGGVEYSEIANELLAASPSFDTFFGLTEERNVDATHDPPEQLSHAYAVRSTSVRLSNDLIESTTHDFVGISYAFETLDLRETEFKPSYTIENFFGELCAMFLLLLGLHFPKMVSGARAFYLSFRYKTFTPVREHFS